jgi:hypothetical protein
MRKIGFVLMLAALVATLMVAFGLTAFADHWPACCG